MKFLKKILECFTWLLIAGLLMLFSNKLQYFGIDFALIGIILGYFFLGLEWSVIFSLSLFAVVLPFSSAQILPFEYLAIPFLAHYVFRFFGVNRGEFGFNLYSLLSLLVIAGIAEILAGVVHLIFINYNLWTLETIAATGYITLNPILILIAYRILQTFLYKSPKLIHKGRNRLYY